MRPINIPFLNGVHWLRAAEQAPTVLGAIMIGLIWASLSFHLEVERNAAERAAVQNSMNLARAFGGNFSHSLSDIDRSLKIMRRSYMLYPDGFDFRDWIHGSLLSSDQILQLSIIGADGFLKLSSIESDSRNQIDLRDREHFQVHLGAKNDDLFISKPVVGRASGKWAVQLSRRIENADGSFGGVLVASVDPTYFGRFHTSVDIGSDGFINIVGTDGIIRIVGGRMSDRIGMDVSGTPLFQRFPESQEGWFYTSSTLSDQIPRLLTYRAVEGYPLIIVIGVSNHDVFAEIYAKRRGYYSVAALLTALIVVVIAAGIRGRRDQQRMSEEIHMQNLRFDVALRNMSQGLCVFDTEKRLAVCNDRYAEIYRLPPELREPGTPHAVIIAHRVSHGMLKGARDETAVRQKLSSLSQLPVDTRSSRIDELTDGRLICVTREPIEGGGWVATHDDITEQKRAEWELDRARRFLDTVIENIPMPIVVKDPDTRKFILVNQAYEAFIGMPREKLIGVTAHELFSESEADLIAKLDTETLLSGQRLISGELVLETSEASSRICNTTRLVVRDGSDRPQYLIVVIEDVTERKKAQNQIAHMAHHDPLTGLPNRARFTERLEEALTRIRRGEQVAVFFLDLDHFKHINDTAGHLTGDEVLKIVAERLRGCLRETDTVARLGGDEFAIIQTSIESSTEIHALASRIQDVIKEPFGVAGLHAAVDVSIGISRAPTDATDSGRLMKQADLALYKAKSDGRSTYRFFESEMDARAKKLRKLEVDLRTAIVNSEFELLYQPVVNLQDNRVVGLEALLRWHHPERGLISPAEFVPTAEETGLIIPLGEWVLRQACSDAANWPDALKIAVNLSPVQFKSRNLVQAVIDTLMASGIAPGRLELELTEAALLSDDRHNVAVLDQLRRLGVRVVMDDFGTGYSSLNYLRSFPFDKIKIDRSFVSDLSRGNDVSLAIVAAVVTLARTLNVTTVAEGVETTTQLELVRAAGCTEFQGFLFSPPRPVAQINGLLASCNQRAVSAA